MLKKYLFTICFTFLITCLYGQVSIKGKVTSENGTSEESLPGASILIKGTTQGTITDLNGEFVLSDVPEDATLIISFIGYLTEEIAVNGRSNIEVSLIPDITSLSEVVVVGYGTQKREDLISAISTIGAEAIEGRPVQSAQELMQGQVAGLSITTDGGEPGSGGKVRIRGVGTFGNNDPLYVVDGVPVNNGLNFLNPNDIESIAVFKDAAAAAIYGSRAANGVVYITTKKGKSGKRQITFDSYYGIVKNGQIQEMANAQEYMEYLELKNLDGQVAGLASRGYDTDWIDNIMRTGTNQSYNLGISGGNDDHRYFTSVGYSKIDGTHLKSDNERLTARLNSSYNIFKWFKFSENLTVTYEKRHNNNLFGAARYNAPIAPVYKTDAEIEALDQSNRSLNQYYDVAEGLGYGFNHRAQIERSNGERRWLSLYGNVQGEIDFGNIFQPLEGLKFTSTMGFERINEDFNSFDPIYRLGVRDFADKTQVHVDYAKYFHWTFNNFLTYNKSFAKHTIGLTAGVVGEEETRSWVNAHGSTGISNSPSLQVIDAMTLDRTNGGSSFRNAYASLVGRVTYNYDERYLVQASIRRDGSFRFAPGKRYGTFPSVGLGWRISNEEFFKNLDLGWVSDLKVRGSWGQLGNERIATSFEYLSTMRGGYERGYVLGGVGGANSSKEFIQGYGPTRAPNPDLSWETTTSTNLGVDLALLDHKVSVGFDYFDRQTTDVLYKKTLPLYSGVPASDGIAPVTQWVNGASINNKGIDVTVNYFNNIGKLGVDVGVVFSRYKVNIDEIKDNIPLTVNDERIPTVIQMREGDPLGSFFGYEVDGFFDAEDELRNSRGEEILAGAQVGDFKFKDQNDDGIIDLRDKKVIGNPNPDFTYSFNINLTYGRFDFKTFWYGVYGNDIYKVGDIYLSGWDEGGAQNILSGVIENAWTPENTDAIYPKVSPGSTKRNYERGPTSYGIKDGSFLRLKNLQLGYTLPSAALERVGFDKIRVYVSAENVFVITKYDGDDPEVGNGIRLNANEGGAAQSPSYIMGLDYGDRYPIQRSLTAGVSLTF